jgi:hypothetical protein
MSKERDEWGASEPIAESQTTTRHTRARYETLSRRIIAATEPIEGQNECGCWSWIGSIGTRGYGQIAIRVPDRRTPRTFLSHRALEQALRDQAAEREFDLAQPGDWWDTPLVMGIKAPPMHPHEETIEHLCAHRSCNNPDHWITVTRAENSALMRKRVTR